MKTRQISVLGLLIGFLLVSAAASAEPCPASGTVLCLSGQRFNVEVDWKDFQGNTGAGRAVTLTPDTGYFWFFSDNNVELVVKVLDARSFNQHFWVFFGALSNVEYALTVTDTQTGATKTYQNPSGQFASVGDTAAFQAAAAGAIATHETVVAEGTPAPPESLAAIQRFVDAVGSTSASELATKSAASFTPCPGRSTSLYLSNCRFQLEVEWTDFQGRTGSGQAVQLTNDTGYFWFFSDNNIELIVKVLDARGFNDRFWVFYGALSNVEYSLHVTDTLSGALRIYRNPSGHFASVGDTSAFRGGYGVAVTSDAGRAASSEISAASGGTVSATAADGTVFTLEVPPHAVASDKTITITPVTAIDRFPFAGGLVAGVNLEPSGLYLLEAGRLTIRTPSPIPQSEETAFAWNGSGEDFFLYPPAPASGDLQIYVVHLGGYGVGRATDGERQGQAEREPVGEDDRLSHRIAPLLREGRAEALGATSMQPSSAATGDWRLRTREEYDAMYELLRDRMARTLGDPDEVVRLGTLIIDWNIGVANNLGPLETAFPGRSEEIRSLVEEMLRRALRIIHARCSSDVTAIRKLPQIMRLISRFAGLNLGTAVQEALKCLSFRLTFTSTTIDFGFSGEGYTSMEHSVRAEIPIKIRPDLDLNDADLLSFQEISGEGEIAYTSVVVNGSNPHCNVTTDVNGSATFWAGIQLPLDFERFDSSEISLYYDPGNPPSKITISCEGSPFAGHIDDFWRTSYIVFHSDEFSGDSAGRGLYRARGWTVTGGSHPFATKTYVQARIFENGQLHETTVMKIDHTPE